jgi:hypothetical protein
MMDRSWFGSLFPSQTGPVQGLGVTEVAQRAKAAGAESRPAGEKLEKSAQGFGESIWDGMKSVGRSLQRFFTGSLVSLSLNY